MVATYSSFLNAMPYYGEKRKVALSLSGYQDLSVENRIAELILEEDYKAAVAVTIQAGARCIDIKPGMTVFIEGYSKPHELFCVRPLGNPTCYWFPSNYLKNSN